MYTVITKQESSEVNVIDPKSRDTVTGHYLQDVSAISKKLLSQTDEVLLFKALEYLSQQVANLVEEIENLEAEQFDCVDIQSIYTDLVEQKRKQVSFYQQKYRQLREKAITKNLKLVISFARKYTGNGVPFPDLIQEGNIGLMKGIDKYDYRRGFRLSTYVSWWIRQSVTRAVAEQSRTIRIPIHQDDLIRRYWKEYIKFERELQCTPTNEEMAEILGIDIEKVNQLLQDSQRSVSLDAEINDDPDSDILLDFIPVEDPGYNEVEMMQLGETLESTLSTLDARSAKVISLRFGLLDGRSRTLEEVGQQFGLTRERIRQIEAEALRKLRHPRRARKLRDFSEAE